MNKVRGKMPLMPTLKVVRNKRKLKPLRSGKIFSKKIIIQPDGVTVVASPSDLTSLMKQNKSGIVSKKSSFASPKISAVSTVIAPNQQQNENGAAAQLQSDIIQSKTIPLNLPPASPKTIQTNTTTPTTPPVGIVIYQYNIQDNSNVLKNNVLQNSTVQIGNDRPSPSRETGSGNGIINPRKKLPAGSLTSKIRLLKADLKAEEQKSQLLQRKMVELRRNLDSLYKATKKTLNDLSTIEPFQESVASSKSS